MIYIIDALGPFIDPEHTPFNWSKIPFADLENIEYLVKRKKDIIRNFATFIQKIKRIGYTAISLDDVAHLVIFEFYSKKTKTCIVKFQKLYAELFTICQNNSISIYINTDIMFFTPEIQKQIKKQKNAYSEILTLLKQSFIQLFEKFSIDGIITRIGESDGVDVQSYFKSSVTIQTPKQAQQFLMSVLPIFEQYNKKLIFRLWTLGSGSIGDLMRNKKKAQKTFANIQSDNLFISIKYGEADFFRDLQLNPLFALPQLQKIIEFQTRREYDFYGELPYYTGFEYEKYMLKLQHNKTIKGMLIWCQTGGWMQSNRITFLHNSSKYVELNTVSTIQIAKGKTANECILDFFNNADYVTFLKKYEQLSHKILYPQHTKKYYFKRLFIPPILWVYWNNLTINRFMATFVKYYYKTCPIIKMSLFDDLQKTGEQVNCLDIGFYVQTLQTLYLARKTLHGVYPMDKFLEEVKAYNDKYNFLVISVQNPKLSKRLQLLLSLTFRKSEKYRVLDRILFNKLFIIIIFKHYLLKKKYSPTFLDTQGMKILDLMR